MEGYCKYIHLLYCHDLKFCESLIKMIQCEPDAFLIGDHMFITPNRCVADELIEKGYTNIIYDNSGKNLYVRYAPKCKWIISHGLEETKRAFLTPKRIKNKVLYRYWGGSRTTQLKLDKNKPIEYIRHRIKIRLFKITMESFAAIGIANNVDILDLNKACDGLKYYRMPYGDKNKSRSRIELMNRIEAETSASKDKTWVLLGHRGKDEDNHIAILKMLEHFDSKKIHIIMPLSYGDEDYIKKVCNYVELQNLNNVDIIKTFLAYEDYLKLLSDVDIAIFDGVTSYALGNIGLVLAFKKKVYLNRDGVIKEAFDMDGIPCGIIQDINDMDLEQFIAPVNYPSELESSLIPVKDSNFSINAWKKVFNDFD